MKRFNGGEASSGIVRSFGRDLTNGFNTLRYAADNSEERDMIIFFFR